MDLKFLEDGKGGFDVRKICWIIILIATIMAIVIVTLRPMLESVGTDTHAWDDVHNYFNQWMKMSEGKIPYKDFTFEYPPLAIPFIAIPGFFCFGNEDAYGVLFTAFCTLAAIIGYVYLVKLGKNLGLNNKIITLLFILCVLLLPKFFLRLEMFMMLFVILGFYFYSERKFALAFSMMALGTMLKLIPAIFAVGMALPFLLRKEWKDLAIYIGICVVICALITLPFLLIDTSSAFDYLTYHSDRGLQIESVAASILLFFNIFTPIVGLAPSYGSMNLTGEIPDAVASVIMYVMVGALVTFIVLSAYRHKSELVMENNTRTVIIIGVISMTIFIALNKVFSGQYLIWVIPLIGLILLDRNNRGIKKDVLFLSVICTVITILPWYSMLAYDLNPLAVIILLIRNIVFCTIIFRLMQLMIEDRRSFCPV